MAIQNNGRLITLEDEDFASGSIAPAELAAHPNRKYEIFRGRLQITGGSGIIRIVVGGVIRLNGGSSDTSIWNHFEFMLALSLASKVNEAVTITGGGGATRLRGWLEIATHIG